MDPVCCYFTISHFHFHSCYIHIGGIEFIVLKEQKNISKLCIDWYLYPGEEKLWGAASEGGGGEDGAELAP